LGLFNAINYLIIAIYEAFRATILFCAIRLPPPISLATFIHTCILLATIIFIILGIVIYLAKTPLLQFLHVPAPLQTFFLYYIVSMLGASIVGCSAYIIFSVFYCLKQVTLSLFFIFLSACANIIFTYLFAYYFHWGMYAIPAAIFMPALIISLLAYYHLFNKKYGNGQFPLLNLAAIYFAIRKIITCGVPVFLSYLTIFMGVFIFNGFLANMGVNAVAGYGVAHRLQTLLILPALAIGVASAIYINDCLACADVFAAKKMLRHGLLLSFVFYIVIALLTFLMSETILSYLVSEAMVRREAINYLLIVSPTYVGVGPFITYLSITEQTGRGTWGWLLNMSYFLVAIAIIAFFVGKYQSSLTIYECIAAVNMGFFLSGFLLFLHKKKLFYGE